MNPLEQFAPPQQPANNTSTPDNGLPQQVANVPSGQESQGQWAKSVGRSHQIKTATNTVIQTRSQLVQYLKQNGLDLLTSSIEFQQTGDFILSSYVIYPQYNNQKEPLGQFMQRYEALKAPVEKIRDSLKPIQSQMNIITKRNY